MNYLLISYMGKDTEGQNRRFGLFFCPECLDTFETRADRLDKMTGLCRACSNKKAGEKRRTHGESNANSRLHVTWSNMKRRCLNPTPKEQRNYKKIWICKEWCEYENFKKWAISAGYTDEKTIDRIDCDSGYYPDNCRFVDYSTQSANRRITERNTSGFIGVILMKDGRYKATVGWKRKQKHLGFYETAKEAAQVRDKYIIDNDLPHTLNEIK